jgi:N-acetyl-anhydromuramyl-L-alanine amidase AmpD
MQRRSYLFPVSILLNLLLALALCMVTITPFALGAVQRARAVSPGSANEAFARAAQDFSVPVSLLKAICYMEGRLSNHNGSPSVDNGFGCMHLVKNRHGDTLDRAASELKVSTNQLKMDLATNIRGGAAILRADALQLSSNKRLPGNLNGWYGAVAAYSQATTRSTALMYANAVYKLLGQGFSGQTDSAEVVSLAPEVVHPDTTTAAAVKGLGVGALPAGCTVNATAVDYPGSVDCMLPAQFDCNKVQGNAPCTYESANRPTDYAINQVVIHDIEGTAIASLSVFQDINSGASVHYIVDSDGTIYQVVPEKDIAYHDGNYWSNQHTIGIEHAGFDADGYKWYNATEYLASAKLTAYLLQKYQIPLDRAHIVSHGTVPSPSATSLPNHVDPGPYWLWSYYLRLIHQQGVAYPGPQSAAHIFIMHPMDARHLLGPNGTETSGNFTFTYLYNGPSTASGRIPQQNISTDITDVTNNVETDISYYYVAKAKDAAGSGDTMYEIWYGEENQAQATPPSRFAHAKLVWLAVPAGAAARGQGTIVTLTTNSSTSGATPTPQGSSSIPQIYGRPITGGNNSILGDAPAGSMFISAFTLFEDGTTNLWYEINYNHRQAWVPASEVVNSAVTPQPQP